MNIKRAIIAVIATVVTFITMTGTAQAHLPYESGYGNSSDYKVWFPDDHISCDYMRVEINMANAPSNAEWVVRRALAAINTIAGTDLVYVGHTTWTKDYVPNEVTVNFFTDTQMAADGFSMNTNGYSTHWHGNPYAEGYVVLRAYEQAQDTEDQQVSIIMHEFGHIVNLDHVAATNERMYYNAKSAQPLALWGNGDVAGLHKVGC